MGCGTGTFVGTPAPGGGIFGTNVPCALAFGTNNTQLNTERLVTARVDYNITDRQKISSATTTISECRPPAPARSSRPSTPSATSRRITGSLNYTYVITPTMVNNFIGSAFWYSAIFGVADFAKTTALMPEEISIKDGGANGGSNFATVGAGFPTGRNVGQAELADDLAWTKGKHTFKAGVAIPSRPRSPTPRSRSSALHRNL